MADEEGPRSARFWQDRANEALSLAADMHDSFAKDAMLSVAGMYERMARHAADRERHSELRLRGSGSKPDEPNAS